MSSNYRQGVMTPPIVSVMTPTTVGNMPSKGTKRRTIRVEDELWNAALETAAGRGDSLPAEIRSFLVGYVGKNDNADQPCLVCGPHCTKGDEHWGYRVGGRVSDRATAPVVVSLSGNAD